MFNTKKPETTTPTRATTPSETPVPSSEPKPRVMADNSQRPNASAGVQESSTISEGCFIKGEISGKNDMIILGRVDGIISLKDNVVTVEKSGNVKANIDAKVVNISGSITGNISANEKIIIHDKGIVSGDMTAPRIILKDGSYFTGNVSMTNNKVNPLKEDVKTRTNKSVKEDVKIQTSRSGELNL